MAKINRRDFLVSGAAGTATIALPVLSSGCSSAGNNPNIKHAPPKDNGPNPTSFRLIMVTDSHVRLETKDPQNIYPSDRLANDKNRHVVKQINQMKPDLVIHLGDIPHTIPDSENHEQVMRNAHGIYKGGIEADFHIAAGNHDIGDKPAAFAASPTVDEKGHEVFEKYFGSTYSSFDYKGCHFVLLNSPVFNSGLPIEKTQRTWLENDLKKNHGNGKRIFFCTHFPLYLNNPKEGEHYDNVGEPSRSWLLSLIEKYDVEAVFAGHAHNFFYNLHGDTDLYALPSVTFVRPDFSAMFNIGPTEEYGRADNNKLGFALLDVKQRGHKLSIIRTYGLTEDRNDTVVQEPLSLRGNNEAVTSSPIGVSLRHSWAKTVLMPFDSLDEFNRKPIRNDYLLQALWELNITKLRIPVGDLDDLETLERMYALRRLGCQFNVFTVGVPDSKVVETITRNKDAVSSLEVIVPRLQIKDAQEPLRSIKRASGVNIYLSAIDVLADQKSDRDFVFSHFPSHGFKLKEMKLLDKCINEFKMGKLIDGFVFRVTAEMDTWKSIQSAHEIAKKLDKKAMVQLKMPRLNEGQSFTDDNAIANIVSEALIASMGSSNVTVFLDTLVDHDRGYFPRHGLMDRRYNPRLPYHVLRHLHHAIAGDDKGFKTSPIKTNLAKAFELKTPKYLCALVLPGRKHMPIELEFGSGVNLNKSEPKVMDLHTGRIKEVGVKVLGKNSLRVDSVDEPVLVVL